MANKVRIIGTIGKTAIDARFEFTAKSLEDVRNKLMYNINGGTRFTISDEFGQTLSFNTSSNKVIDLRVMAGW